MRGMEELLEPKSTHKNRCCRYFGGSLDLYSLDGLGKYSVCEHT